MAANGLAAATRGDKGSFANQLREDTSITASALRPSICALIAETKANAWRYGALAMLRSRLRGHFCGLRPGDPLANQSVSAIGWRHGDDNQSRNAQAGHNRFHQLPGQHCKPLKIWITNILLRYTSHSLFILMIPKVQPANSTRTCTQVNNLQTNSRTRLMFQRLSLRSKILPFEYVTGEYSSHGGRRRYYP